LGTPGKLAFDLPAEDREVNRSEFQQLARDRIRDAKAELDAHRWAAAYYLAGYAVECALKACAAKLIKAEEFPDKSQAEKCWTHDLERLVVVAGIKDARDAAAKENANFAANWRTVAAWDESSRYARSGRVQTRQLCRAITHAKHGVFPRIRSRW
jgi:HEPN domain-containing protein